MISCLSDKFFKGPATMLLDNLIKQLRLHRWPMPGFLVVLALLAQNVQAEQYVEVNAEIRITAFLLGEKHPDSVRGYTFSTQCIIGTNKWLIQSDAARLAEVKWYFDGTNVYKSSRAIAGTPKEIEDQMKARGYQPTPFEVAKSNITITVGPDFAGYPSGDESVNLPWLAFCSGGYLRNLNRVVPVPVTALGNAPDALAYYDETQCFEDPLGLPRSMVLFTSEALFRASLERSEFRGNRDPAVWKRAGWLPGEGHVKFQYSVLASTNFHGWNLPLEFEFVQFAPVQDGGWGVKIRGAGVTKYMSLTGEPQNLFRPEFTQTVVDRRFRDERVRLDALRYRGHESSVPPTNDAVLQQKLTRQVAQNEKALARMAPSHHGATPAVVAMMLIFFVTPLVVLGLLLMKNKNSDGQQ
jgi:hypothetical protein